MVTEREIYFFGCWGDAGHYLHDRHGRKRYNERGTSWPDLDGTLVPGPRDRYDRPTGEQVEGRAALHRKDGWTALAWWDRSVDRREGSNAVLLVRGALSAGEMLVLRREMLPDVWSRFGYEIVVVEEEGSDKR